MIPQFENSKIYIAGYTGMVGSAFLRELRTMGCRKLMVFDRTVLDLRDYRAVREVLSKDAPDYIFFAAGTVGGIMANMTFPVEHLEDNLEMTVNIIRFSAEFGVKRLVLMGSSCMYPREAIQPMKEDSLLTGALEPTNEAFALAKITGMKLAQYYAKQKGLNVLLPVASNLFGPRDNFDPQNSHVVAALMRKIHDAKATGIDSLTLWGTGNPRREFLFVDDFVRAVLFLLDRWTTHEFINVGMGTDYSIKELASMLCEIIGFEGRISWDSTKPDGMPRKCLDVSKLNSLGFKANRDLQSLLKVTYDYFLDTYEKGDRH